MKNIFIIIFIFFLFLFVAMTYNFLVGETGVSGNYMFDNKQNNGENMNKVKIEAEQLALFDGEYDIQPQISSLVWSAGKIIGESTTGTLRLTSGFLSIVDGKPRKLELVVDMGSIEESKRNKAFEKHVMSSDFFDVESYPESKLNLYIFEERDGAYLAKGELEIKGRSELVEILLFFLASENNLEIISEFEIDRTKWDIVYGSGKFFKEIGDATIKDEIGFKLNLFAVSSSK